MRSSCRTRPVVGMSGADVKKHPVNELKEQLDIREASADGAGLSGGDPGFAVCRHADKEDENEHLEMESRQGGEIKEERGQEFSPHMGGFDHEAGEESLEILGDHQSKPDVGLHPGQQPWFDVKTELKTEEEEESGQPGECHEERGAVDDWEEEEGTKEVRYGRKRPYKEDSAHSYYEHCEDKRSRYPPPPAEEDEEDFDDSLVTIDTYNCDLHFKVSRDRYSGYPLTIEGFAYLWSGARASYGVSSGRICYEIKINEEISVKHLPSGEPDPHVARIGWSLDSCSTQLGEEAFSYGYGGTGKKSSNCKFEDYGEKFGENDVIGCFIDFESGDEVEMSFSKNGKCLGVAFRVAKAELAGRSLFPHVLVKNCAVEFNFGQQEQPNFPPLENYTFIQHVWLEDRMRGAVGPATRSDCEILMMVGLPASGKTTWAIKYALENPEKKYNILGTNSIMEKMKVRLLVKLKALKNALILDSLSIQVMGLRRQRNYAGRWDILIQQATQCLNRLIQIAARKRRNYILDQTNVYGSAQRRKMRPFEGFQRKAVVICPTEEDLKERTKRQIEEEGKDVPDHAVLEMKANFVLPESGDFLTEVLFVELQHEEAALLVKQYNEEGRKAGPPPERRHEGRQAGYRGRGGYQRYENRAGPPGGYQNRGGGFRGGYNCGGNHQNRWSNHRGSAPGGRDGYGRNYSGGYSHSRQGPYAKGMYSQGYSQGYNQGYEQDSYNPGYYGNYSQYPGYEQSYSEPSAHTYNQQYQQYAQQWQQYYQNQSQWNQYYGQYGDYSSQGSQGSQGGR